MMKLQHKVEIEVPGKKTCINGIKYFHSYQYLIFPPSLNPSAGIYRNRMQSLSMNPVKCGREQIYRILFQYLFYLLIF